MIRRLWFLQRFFRGHTHTTLSFIFFSCIYMCFFCGVTPGGDQDNGVNGAIIIKN